MVDVFETLQGLPSPLPPALCLRSHPPWKRGGRRADGCGVSAGSGCEAGQPRRLWGDMAGGRG